MSQRATPVIATRAVIALQEEGGREAAKRCGPGKAHGAAVTESESPVRASVSATAAALLSTLDLRRSSHHQSVERVALAGDVEEYHRGKDASYAAELALLHLERGMSSTAPASDPPSTSAVEPVPQSGPSERKATTRKKRETTRVVDPRLDFFSASFDPVLALATAGLRPPLPDVAPLVSVAMCRGLLPHDHPQYKAASRPQTQPATAQRSSATAAAPVTADSSRRAQQPEDDALAVFSTRPYIPPSLSASASSRSRQSSSSPSPPTAGPLSLVHSLFSSQSRCTVLTRSHREVYSRCHGLIRAFDKHLSLFLIDVTEEIAVRQRLTVQERQRKKGRRRRPDQAVSAEAEAAVEETSGRHWEWVEVERELCVWQPRHVPQMLLRGACVISISRYRET